jgi:glycine dehydrogenase subunit 1
MPFIPHTESDIRAMLAAIGAPDIDALFEEIPPTLRAPGLPGVPPALNEMEVGRLMADFATRDGRPLNFIGAGAYEHHIPSAVWAIVTRGEFYSAYTPYQAEASQGTLQLLYEYQTMMASLTGLDISNASLYDGASGLAEACLMAVRANRKSKSQRILLPVALNPTYRDVTQVVAGNQNIAFERLPYDQRGGQTLVSALDAYTGQDITAVVLQQPNFFGTLEDVDAATDWAHANNALMIGVVNPTSLAVLKPPGQWGKLGRIIGRTLDLDGKTGFTLTLQAREQHIRRAKATSNICTNQGLLVTAATIYMSLLGAKGLAQVASTSMQRTQQLVDALTRVPGVRLAFDRPRFHEAVLLLDRPVKPVLEALAGRGIIGGADISVRYPSLGNALLVCATETRTLADIETYARELTETMRSSAAAA